MESDQNKSSRIAKNTLVLFLRMLLVIGVGLYTSRIVLDILGIENFGIYNVVGAIVILFSFFQNALTNATYRYFAYDLGTNNILHLKRTFSMAINVHAILAIALFFISETVGLYFLNTKLNIAANRMFAANIAYQFSILSFCANVLKTPYNSSIIAHEKMSFFALTSIIEAVLKLLIVFALTLFNADKLILYACLTFIIALLLLFCFHLYCRKQFTECTYVRSWDKPLLNKMLKYSCWSMTVNGADVCGNQSIVFFFNIFFGVVANAALGFANQVEGCLNLFLHSFTQAYNPQIIKSYASKDYSYFYKLLFSTSKLTFYLLFLLAVPILLNIDYILELWLKEVPKDTSVFVIVLVVYCLIDAYSAPLWIGVHATGKLKGHQLLISTIKILYIPLAYLLLKNGFSASSALAVKAGLNFVCSIVRPCYVNKLYNLPLKRYFLKVFIPVYGITLFTLVPTLYVNNFFDKDLQKTIITTIFFEAIALFLIYIWGTNKKEKIFIKQLVKRKNTHSL